MALLITSLHLPSASASENIFGRNLLENAKDYDTDNDKTVIDGKTASGSGKTASGCGSDKTASGCGWDFGTKEQSKKNKEPAYFSVKVADGNYRVTLTLGSDKYAANTTVRCESRRLLVENVATKKGEEKTFVFTVHKRSPEISDGSQVKLKSREVGYLNWDEKLTFEFNGKAPAVKSLKIEKDTSAVTFFLCGDSTTVDQEAEPWSSWGQMITRWFDEKVCVANYAESGETTTSFVAEKRFDKVLDMMKAGDFVAVEFGHNDEKDKGDNAGAYKNYSENLRTYVAKIREKGGNPIILSPTARRWFNGDKVINTHGDYPEAAKKVAEDLSVPFIDITAMTTEMFEAVGAEGAKSFLVHYPANTFPNQEKALKDDTHFNPFGAYEVSKCVVMGLKAVNSPLASHIISDWKDFNPAKPDDKAKFVWYGAPDPDTLKPDGA